MGSSTSVLPLLPFERDVEVVAFDYSSLVKGAGLACFGEGNKEGEINVNTVPLNDLFLDPDYFREIVRSLTLRARVVVVLAWQQPKTLLITLLNRIFAASAFGRAPPFNEYNVVSAEEFGERTCVAPSVDSKWSVRRLQYLQSRFSSIFSAKQILLVDQNPIRLRQADAAGFRTYALPLDKGLTRLSGASTSSTATATATATAETEKKLPAAARLLQQLINTGAPALMHL